MRKSVICWQSFVLRSLGRMLAILLCVLPLGSLAQKPLTEQLNSVLRFAPNAIYDMLIDKKGYLYLATTDGLYRYDGFQMQHWGLAAGAGQSITALQEDKHGRIWFKDFNSTIYIFDGEKTNTHLSSASLHKQYGEIFDFVITDSVLYVVHLQAIVQYKSGKKKIIAQSKSGSVFYSVAANRDKIAFINTDGELYELQESTEKLSKRTLRMLERVHYKMRFFKNQLFLIQKTAADFPLYNISARPQKGIAIHQKLSVFHATQDDDSFWLCTNNGAYPFDGQALNAANVLLPDKAVTDVVRDRWGGLWISTLDGLLYRTEENKITQHFEELDIRSLLLQNQKLWIGTNDGYLAASQKSLLHYQKSHDKTAFEIAFLASQKTNEIFCNGGVWDGKLFKIKRKIQIGRQIVADSNGDLLIASYSKAVVTGGDLKAKPKLPAPEKIQLQPNESPQLILRQGRAISCAIISNPFRYAVGFSDGLFLFDTQGLTKEIRTADGQAIRATALVVHQDTLWAAGQMGLYSFPLRTAETATLVASNFSAIQMVRGQNNRLLMLDSEGRLLSYRTGEKLQCHFQPEDAILLKIRNLTAYNDTVILASNRGLLQMKLRYNTPVLLPYLRIDTLLARQKLRQNATFQLGTSLAFAPHQVALSAKAKATIEYRSDQDSTWRVWDTRQYGWTSENATVGTHWVSFRSKGLWGTSVPATVTWVAVAPPFVLTLPWVIGILAVLAIGAGIAYVVVKRRQRMQALTASMIESQLTALGAQMNPHFIFNILQSVQGLVFEEDKNKVLSLLSEYAELTRRILDFSDKKWITIGDEIKTLNLYLKLESGRFSEGDELDWRIDKSPELSNEIQIPSQIIQPLAENAIKHGLMHVMGRKILRISIEKAANNAVTIRVDDNGIGRKQSALKRKSLHKPFATNALQKRIELFGQMTRTEIKLQYLDKEIEDVAAGTTAVITLPTLSHESITH